MAARPLSNSDAAYREFSMLFVWRSPRPPSSPETPPAPVENRRAHLFRPFLRRPVTAAAREMLLQVRHDRLHAVGGGGRQHQIQLGHDHQAGDAHDMIRIRGEPPIASHVAIPVDAAGEARPPERIDVDLHLVRRQERLSWVAFGIVFGDDLRKREIELGRRADARLRRARRRGTAAGHRAAHEEVERLLDVFGEDAIGLARRILELHDIHAFTEALAKDRDRIDWRAGPVRRIDPDYAGYARQMAQRHLPD